MRSLCESICGKFSQKIKSLYSRFDWDSGFIISKNRHGFEESFPIATLSVAAVTNRELHPNSMEELSLLIAGAKKKCKQQEGNAIEIV